MTKKILSALCLCFVLLLCCACNGQGGDGNSETERNDDIIMNIEKSSYTDSDDSVICTVTNNSDNLTYSTKDDGIQKKNGDKWEDVSVGMPVFEVSYVLNPGDSKEQSFPVSDDWEPGDYRAWITFECRNNNSETTVYSEFKFE